MQGFKPASHVNQLMNIPGPLYVVVESVLEVAQTRLKYGGAQCEMVEKEVDGEREREPDSGQVACPPLFSFLCRQMVGSGVCLAFSLLLV